MSELFLWCLMTTICCSIIFTGVRIATAIEASTNQLRMLHEDISMLRAVIVSEAGRDAKPDLRHN